MAEGTVVQINRDLPVCLPFPIIKIMASSVRACSCQLPAHTGKNGLGDALPGADSCSGADRCCG